MKVMSRPHRGQPSSTRRGRTQGWTLIEIIGGLAIIAILAAAIAPVAVRRIDQAVLTKEVADLSAISNALVLQVMRNASIPGPTNWSQSASTWAQLPLSSISTTPRGFNRAFLVDGSGWFSTNLYYAQSPQGTPAPPSSTRAMIVASIAGTNPPVTSGVPTTASFNDLWNTQDQAKPSSWTGWSGNGSDVVIQRLNFQPLFHRVILWVRETNSAAPAYAINNSSPIPLSTTNNLDAYFLDGSVLGMFTNNVLALTEIVKSDLSRVFEEGIWSDQIRSGPPISTAASTNLESTAYNFVTSPAPVGSLKGDTVYGAAEQLLAYMLAYSSWSSPNNAGNTCFYYNGTGQAKKVEEYVLLQNVINCFGNGANATCTLVP